MQASPSISVIVPVFKSRADHLQRAFAALLAQTFPREAWELIVVDNHPSTPVVERADIAIPPGTVVIEEAAMGLTRALVAGFKAAKGELAITIADDNVVAPDYLAEAWRIAGDFPFLGTWGANIEAEFERPGFTLARQHEPLVSVRSVPETRWSNVIEHHDSTPWGAGMCIRRQVFETYVSELERDARRLELDLSGATRKYGGDTDIVYTGCRMGLGKGVFSSLRLTHLIGADRCTPEFLRKVAFGRGYSEVIHEHLSHGTLAQVSSSPFAWAIEKLRQLRLPAFDRSIRQALLAGKRQGLAELRQASGSSR